RIAGPRTAASRSSTPPGNRSRGATSAAGGNPASCRLSFQYPETPDPNASPANTMHPTQIIRSLAFVVAAGAALAASPAFAQRASLADRVAALEQQAANNRGNVDLLNQ